MDLDANSCNFFLFVRPVLKRFIFSVPYILFICLKIPLFSIKLLVFPFWRLSKTAWTFCIPGKCSTVIMINTEAKSALLFVMVILSSPPPILFRKATIVVLSDFLWIQMFFLCLGSDWIANCTAFSSSSLMCNFFSQKDPGSPRVLCYEWYFLSPPCFWCKYFYH